ncbi:hypothetical protein PIB30_105535, partial [Stylosanthes scabra]|nr:hypothetical protein [Stylosanthes scabra]
MRSSSEASSSPSCRSKKHNNLSSNLVSSDSDSLDTKTPEKSLELTRRTRNRDVAFPCRRYEILGEYFARLDCSIRLLRRKGMTPSFAKISHTIESLTDRRFTLGHLAQLKFLLPEAI